MTTTHEPGTRARILKDVNYHEFPVDTVVYLTARKTARDFLVTIREDWQDVTVDDWRAGETAWVLPEEFEIVSEPAPADEILVDQKRAQALFAARTVLGDVTTEEIILGASFILGENVFQDEPAEAAEPAGYVDLDTPLVLTDRDGDSIEIHKGYGPSVDAHLVAERGSERIGIYVERGTLDALIERLIALRDRT